MRIEQPRNFVLNIAAVPLSILVQLSKANPLKGLLVYRFCYESGLPWSGIGLLVDDRKGGVRKRGLQGCFGIC